MTWNKLTIGIAWGSYIIYSNIPYLPPPPLSPCVKTYLLHGKPKIPYLLNLMDYVAIWTQDVNGIQGHLSFNGLNSQQNTDLVTYTTN